MYRFLTSRVFDTCVDGELTGTSLRSLASEIAFSALTLLVGRQEEHPTSKNERRGAGVFICLQQGANDLDIIQLMPLLFHHLLLH